MPFFKLTAEHLNRRNANSIISHAEVTMGLHVLHAGHDDVFTDLFHIVIEASQKEADKLREFMWHKNNGAFCEVVKDWTEEMDWDASWL